jgi:uncharacterized protein YjbI with pentapeptide repeats
VANKPSLQHEHSAFPKSRFQDVDLSDCVFDDVNLQRARFENVALTGAQLRNVNLSHVSIDDANLEGMKINGVLVVDLIRAYEGKTGRGT